MKRFLSLVLCFAMLFALVPFSAVADSNQIVLGGVTYIIDGDTCYINKCDVSVTSLTIPKRVNGYLVTHIGPWAFSGCEKLVSVVIPDSVETMASGPFIGCISLQSIVIPDSVTYMRGGAFEGCTSLKSVVIGNSLGSIGEKMFYGCTSLQSVKFGASVDYIGSRAFSGCTSLQSIEIPDTVTHIGTSAFFGCTSLQSIKIPDTVTYIGGSVFENCSNLENIDIPTDVILGENMFEGCDNLPYTEYDGGKYYGTESNPYQILYSALSTDITETTIHNNTKQIASYAFNNCSKLSKVIISDSVTIIGDYAFENCSHLSSIIIPDSVTIIGDYAFYNCFSNWDSADVYCEAPEQPSGWSDAWDNGAYYSTLHWGYGLDKETMVIMRGVTYILSDNKSYYYLEVCNDDSSWVTIHSKINDLPVKSISDSAFYGCSNLRNITIPTSVTTIGNSAFSGCTSLTSIEIPDSVTKIGNYVFSNCDSLESIIVSSENKKYHSKDNCLIETATNTLISGCKNSIIPNYVTTIGNSVFSGCSGLRNITIPNSVTTIGKYVFGGCYDLTDIYCEATEQPEGWDAYWNFEYDGWFGSPINATVHWGYVIDREPTEGEIEPDYSEEPFVSEEISEEVSEETSKNISDIIEVNVALGKPYTTSKIWAQDSNWNYDENGTIPYPDENGKTLTDGKIANGSYEDIAWVGLNTQTPDAAAKGYTWVKVDLGGNYIVNKIALCVPAFDFGSGVNTPQLVVFYDGNGKKLGNGTLCDLNSYTKAFVLEGEFNVSVVDARIGNTWGWNFVCELAVGIDPAASTVVADGITYTLSYDKTYYIVSDCDTSVTNLTIPSQINGVPVKRIAHVTFEGCTNLKSVVIPDSVTEIGLSAFANFTSLQSIVIPNSVTTIGPSAFSGCTSLESVVIPDSVTTIGNGAFSKCTSLKSIEIPNSVTTIDSLVQGCTSLESIVIPDSVTKIVDYSFRGCINLESIVIPDSVTYIGQMAFSGCTSLTNITIPASVTTMGPAVFDGCDGLQYICCEAESQPEGWHSSWNFSKSDIPVYWGGIVCTEHTPQDDKLYSSDTNHWQLCACGEKLNVTAHRKGAAADCENDQICLDCGYVIEEAKGHSPANNTLYSNSTNHWQLCSCGEKLNVTSHRKGAAADCENPQTCLDCGYIIQKAKGHTSVDGVIYRDKNEHWQICVCGDTFGLSSHVGEEWTVTIAAKLDKAGEKKLYCSVCDYHMDTAEIPAIHLPEVEEVWFTDSNNHWQECGCGKKLNAAKHTAGNWIIVKEATETTDGKKELRCNVCDYLIDSEIIPSGISSRPQININGDIIINGDININNQFTNINIHFGNAFDSDTVINISEIKNGAEYEQISKFLANISSLFNAYDFSAMKNGEIVQPKETFTMDFVIPSNFSNDVSVLYIAPDGSMEEMPSTVDEAKRIITAEISHFSVYVLVDNATKDEADVMIGDINGNGKIDMTDYVLLKRAYFGTFNFSETQNITGDINGNGKIDMTDYVLLKRAYFGTYVIK